VLDQQEVDKENVPPQTISNIIQRSTRINKMPTTNPRDKWSSELSEATMDVVEKKIIFFLGGQQVLGHTCNFIL